MDNLPTLDPAGAASSGTKGDELKRPFYRYGGHIEFIRFKEYYGMPSGTRAVFTHAFRAKRELHCIFLGKKAIIITSQHGTTIFLSHYNLFIGRLKEKLARKARVNTERVNRIVLQPRSQVLSPSRSVETGRREPWERGWSCSCPLDIL